MDRLLKIFTDFAGKKGIDDSAYIVGGAVRDVLLDNDLKDIDIAVKGDAVSIAREFASQTGSSFVLMDKDFGIARVVNGDEYLDICAMRGETIYTDLAERDITINAMAIPLKKSYELGVMSHELKREQSEKLIDPYSGRDDLRNKIIRMVSEKNLIDDPLRLLRVYRFAATLGFSIESITLDSVKRLAPMINTAAAERTAEELRHILRLDNSFKTIEVMADDGILYHILPGLKESNQEEILLLYKETERVLNNFSQFFQASAFNLKPFEEYFGPDYRSICLKLSVIFRDTETAGEAAAKLKMSIKETEFLCKMVLNRPRLLKLHEESRGIPNTIATIGLLKIFQADIYPLVILTIAQTLSGQPSTASSAAVISFCRDLVTYYHNQFLPRLRLLPLITGDDLINEFRLKPSPIFGKILSQIDDMILEGVIDSREEALKAAQEIIKPQP